MSATAMITLPMSEWNSMRRDMKAIKEALAIKGPEKIVWVKRSTLIAKGLTYGEIRYKRNEGNSRKTSNGRYEYDLNAFIK
jgi:hypothetical protein